MSITAKMICDSISESGIRLSTVQVTMPKFLLAQLNTHRMFSRNAASSRAIPTSKVMDRVLKDPVMPVFWGKNKPGMQAREECNNPIEMWTLDYEGDPETPYYVPREYFWLMVRDDAYYGANKFLKSGYHKQIVNRILEPFMYVDVLITATEWDNFFDLRLHDSAQPEMREVARVIRNVMDYSNPTTLLERDWHLPYITTDEWEEAYSPDTPFLDNIIKCSVARCARVSYLNHDLTNIDPKKDLELYELLHKEKHLSPFEHQATPMRDSVTTQHHAVVNWQPGITHMDKGFNLWSGNLRGFLQNRQLLTT